MKPAWTGLLAGLLLNGAACAAGALPGDSLYHFDARFSDQNGQEFTLRAALGAGWSHIARHMLVESLALALLGGLLGVGLAYLGLRLLVATAPRASATPPTAQTATELGRIYAADFHDAQKGWALADVVSTQPRINVVRTVGRANSATAV